MRSVVSWDNTFEFGEHGGTMGDEAELANIVNELATDVRLLKVQASKESKPWYRSASVIVSVLSLLFACGTWYVSYNRDNVQEKISRRSDLRNALQRISAIAKDNADSIAKYGISSDQYKALSGFYGQETALTARMAVNIAESLAESEISATEYFAIANALQMSQDCEDAILYVEKAIRKSNRLADLVASLRLKGGLLFAIGKLEEGRAQYQKALGVFGTFKIYDKNVQNFTHYQTELIWSQLEYYAKNFELALQHLQNAEKHLSILPASNAIEGLKRDIKMQIEAIRRPQRSSAGDFLFGRQQPGLNPDAWYRGEPRPGEIGQQQAD